MIDLMELHKKCGQIFEKGFFFDEETPNSKRYPSNACKIYDKLTEGNDDVQDCIGENFNKMIFDMHNEWFGSYVPSSSLEYYFSSYILQLYLFVERVDLIFDVLNVGGNAKIFRDFQHTNFKSLRIINKWANFIKHPKEFLFTHWPYYYIDGKTNVHKNDNDITIDTEFIFKHYDKEQNPRPIILQNNNRVFVQIPNLEKLTERFCIEMNSFFNFICQNQLVADFLKKKSTIVYMYDDEQNI